MSRYLILLFILISFSCKPDLIIDGKGYNLRKRCVKKEVKMVYRFHHYNHIGKHLQPVYMHQPTNVCVEYVTDTIPVKP